MVVIIVPYFKLPAKYKFALILISAWNWKTKWNVAALCLKCAVTFLLQSRFYYLQGHTGVLEHSKS